MGGFSIFFPKAARRRYPVGDGSHPPVPPPAGGPRTPAPSRSPGRFDNQGGRGGPAHSLALPAEARTIARMPARMASGSVGHAVTTAASSGSVGLVSGVDLVQFSRQWPVSPWATFCVTSVSTTGCGVSGVCPDRGSSPLGVVQETRFSTPRGGLFSIFSEKGENSRGFHGTHR